MSERSVEVPSPTAPLRAGRPGLPARRGAVGEGTSTDLSDMVTLVSVRRQEAKIDFFWLSMLFTRPSTSFGLPMKVWIAGIMTVDAKSGRVSRSMNCEMFLALPMKSTAFFCRRVYPEASALLLVAMTVGSPLTYTSCAAAAVSYTHLTLPTNREV